MKSLKAIFILLFILASCSKHLNTIERGALAGNIKVYDKYGKENPSFGDISISLIDKLNHVSPGTVATDGSFRFENVLTGDVFITLNKPGYGFTDTLKFDHELLNDTISNIDLIEELPFSIKFNGIAYGNGTLYYPLTWDYHTTTDSFMATYYMCFSKYSDATLNHANLLWPSGVGMNVGFVGAYYGGSCTFPLKQFTDAGFKKGDKIYASLIPAIVQFGISYYNQNINYKITSYKVHNASNVLSFTLHE